jgi:hypothetical protein
MLIRRVALSVVILGFVGAVYGEESKEGKIAAYEGVLHKMRLDTEGDDEVSGVLTVWVLSDKLQEKRVELRKGVQVVVDGKVSDVLSLFTLVAKTDSMFERLQNNRAPIRVKVRYITPRSELALEVQVTSGVKEKGK